MNFFLLVLMKVTPAACIVFCTFVHVLPAHLLSQPLTKQVNLRAQFEKEGPHRDSCSWFGIGAIWIADANGDGERDIIIPDVDCPVRVAAEGSSCGILFVVSGRDGSLLKYVKAPAGAWKFGEMLLDLGPAAEGLQGNGVLVSSYYKDELGDSHTQIYHLDPIDGSLQPWSRDECWNGRGEGTLLLLDDVDQGGERDVLILTDLRNGSKRTSQRLLYSLESKEPILSLTEPEVNGEGPAILSVCLVSDVDGDGFRDVALAFASVGRAAGEEGVVRIVSGADLTEIGRIFSPPGTKRFGASLAFGDFIGDSGYELAVGEPGGASRVQPAVYIYGSDGWGQVGTVHVPEGFPKPFLVGHFGALLARVPPQAYSADGSRSGRGPLLVVADQGRNWEGLVWAQDPATGDVAWLSIAPEDSPGHYGASLTCDHVSDLSFSATKLLVGTANAQLAADHLVCVIDAASGKQLFVLRRSLLHAAARQ